MLSSQIAIRIEFLHIDSAIKVVNKLEFASTFVEHLIDFVASVENLNHFIFSLDQRSVSIIRMQTEKSSTTTANPGVESS